MDLRRFFPTYLDLEGAPIPIVADKLLRHIAEIAGPDASRPFNVRNLTGEVRGLYESRWECARAASEAFAWLTSKQYVVQAPGSDVGWYCLSRLGSEALAQDDISSWTAERELSIEWVHPLIANEALDHFRQGKFDTAVFVAYRALEVEIRTAAELGHDLVGTALAARAFHPKDGPLTDLDAEGGERQALMNLMSGAIGSYKNPTSHRHVELTGQEAREMLIIASHLIRIVQSRRSAQAGGGQQ